MHFCCHYSSSWEGAASFCPWRGFLTSIQHQAMECFHKLGHFLRAGAYCQKHLFWGLTLTGALETVVGGHMAVSLGLGAVLGLNLLVGTVLFLFSTALSFLTFRVCVQLRGLLLTTRGLRYWTHFPFYLQECLHLFDYCRVGAEPCAQWGTFY